MRRGLKILAAACWLWLAATCSAAERYSAAITAEKAGDAYLIVARNSGAATMSVRISLLEASNVHSEPALPLYAVVPPNTSSLVLARITAESPKERYSFKLRSRQVAGDIDAIPEETPYRLPFQDGQRFIIGQAPGGLIKTHTTRESLFAVDIPMPEGTPIVAARDGVVVYVESGQNVSTQNADRFALANAIRLQHADGTLATYAHLQKDGVLVSLGQKVKAGEVIAYSGNTGYSSGPHLHFGVYRPMRSAEEFAQVSFPFRFYVGSPPLEFAPEFGLMVEADYTRPGEAPVVSPRVITYTSAEMTK